MQAWKFVFLLRLCCNPAVLSMGLIQQAMFDLLKNGVVHSASEGTLGLMLSIWGVEGETSWVVIASPATSNHKPLYFTQSLIPK